MEIPPCFHQRLIESEQRYDEQERAIREEVAVLAREDFEGEVLAKMEQGMSRCEAEKQARRELKGWMDGWTALQKQRMQEVFLGRIIRNYFVYRALR